MSHLKEKLSTIDTMLANLDKRKEEIYSRENELKNERHKIIQNIFAEESPLNNTKWELSIGHSNNVYLQYIGEQSKIKDVDDLCCTGWHCSFEVQDGISLRFDDGEVSLFLSKNENIEQLISFIKKNNLTIVATDITDEVQKLSKQLTALQEICRHFNL